MKDVILGIDLGTTFSTMAVVDQFGKSTVLPNSDGHPTTPSVVHFYEPGACVIGEEAVKSVVADPANSIRFVKRLLKTQNLKQHLENLLTNVLECRNLIASICFGKRKGCS